jgi:putative ABC transport system ATP-binding protein
VEPIIKIKGLRKVYRLGGEKVVALGRINLDIAPGTICCILGTSGSGKSTLLNQLAGLEKPTGGEVFVLGKNISKMDEKQLAVFRQKHLGFVFQSYNLMQGMSAQDNVALPLTFRGVPKTTRRKMAQKMLEQVGLKDRAKHRPNQMSGGQQQRVGIARAFVCRPKVVFADEPTGNLDSKTTLEVMELMVDMARRYNQTIVLVTHDTELAAYADRIITLVDGNVVEDRTNTPCYVPSFCKEQAAQQTESPEEPGQQAAE